MDFPEKKKMSIKDMSVLQKLVQLFSCWTGENMLAFALLFTLPLATNAGLFGKYIRHSHFMYWQCLGNDVLFYT